MVWNYELYTVRHPIRPKTTHSVAIRRPWSRLPGRKQALHRGSSHPTHKTSFKKNKMKRSLSLNYVLWLKNPVNVLYERTRLSSILLARGGLVSVVWVVYSSGRDSITTLLACLIVPSLCRFRTVANLVLLNAAQNIWRLQQERNCYKLNKAIWWSILTPI